MNRTYRILAVILTTALLSAALPFQAAAYIPYEGRLYLSDQDKGTCRQISSEGFKRALLEEGIYGDIAPQGLEEAVVEGVPKLPVSGSPSKEKATAVLLWVLTDARADAIDGNRRGYELRPGELKVSGITYALTQKQYDSLKNAVYEADEILRYPVDYYPEWLRWTSVLAVERIKIRDGEKTYPDREVREYPGFHSLPLSLLNIRVESGGEIYDTGSKLGAFPKATEAVMTLKSGRNLNVIINGGKLYVELSDKNYGYEYEIISSATPAEDLRELLAQE